MIMPRYVVGRTYHMIDHITIAADNEEEAKDKAENEYLYEEGEIVSTQLDVSVSPPIFSIDGVVQN